MLQLLLFFAVFLHQSTLLNESENVFFVPEMKHHADHQILMKSDQISKGNFVLVKDFFQIKHLLHWRKIIVFAFDAPVWFVDFEIDRIEIATLTWNLRNGICALNSVAPRNKFEI